MTEIQKKEAKLFLEGISIHLIRNVARLVGVPQPTTAPKAKLIDNIIDILNGELTVSNKYRGRPAKIGDGIYGRCESILEKLKSILGIEDSLICKTIMFRQQTKSMPKFAALSFKQYVSGMLSLCEGQSELEIMTRIMLELSTIKENQKSRNAI